MQLLAVNIGNDALVSLQKYGIDKVMRNLKTVTSISCWYNYHLRDCLILSCWKIHWADCFKGPISRLLFDQELNHGNFEDTALLIVQNDRTLSLRSCENMFYWVRLLRFFPLPNFLRWFDIVVMLKRIIRHFSDTLISDGATNVFKCWLSITDRPPLWLLSRKFVSAVKIHRLTLQSLTLPYVNNSSSLRSLE